MDVLPSKPAPQTPMGPMKSALGVEESRAQRHQRQQSRFRDRGGIFKPSNRNTLVDILMGRRAPSPKKLLRRSTSCSPSKRDKTPSRLDVDKTRVSCDNSAVSPTKTKTSRKTRSLVPPQATLEENRTSHLHESQAEETAAQPMAKRRGRPSKQSNPTGNAKESRPKSKRKTSKSESAPRRKRTAPQKAKSSPAEKSELAAGSSGAQTKPLSKLSTIAEEAERSEFSDDAMAARMKRKKNHVAARTGMSKTVVTADEEPTINRDRKQGTRAPGSPSVTAETYSEKKSSSNKPTAATLTQRQESILSSQPNAPTPARRQANGSDPGFKVAATDGDEVTTNSDELADANEIPLTEDGSSKPASRRKRQKTGSYDVEVENQGRCAKRVRPCIAGMKDGEINKTSKRSERGANASIPKCQDIDFIAKITNLSKESEREGKVKPGPSVTNVSLEMSGAQSKKRERNPEDSSLTLCPSKRFKPDEANASSRDWSAKSGNGQAEADSEVADKRVPSSRKLKENNATSERPPKPTTQGSKAKVSNSPNQSTTRADVDRKTSNKRGKGPPRRVLQRLKNSEPHPIDDEPDPIDFLS